MIPTSPSLLRPAPGAVPSNPRVVVTGLGAVTPFGVGVARLWEGLLAGRSAIRPITGFDTADLPVEDRWGSAGLRGGRPHGPPLGRADGHLRPLRGRGRPRGDRDGEPAR